MIHFNILNKKTGRTVVLNQKAKELLFRDPSNLDYYKELNECDQFGKTFEYNNFIEKTLIDTNGKQPISIEQQKEVQRNGTEDSNRNEGNIESNITNNTNNRKPAKNKRVKSDK